MKITSTSQQLSPDTALVSAQPTVQGAQSAVNLVDQCEPQDIPLPPSAPRSPVPQLQAPSPNRAPSPVHVPAPSPADMFDALLDATSDLLNNDQPQAALRLLQPQAATTQARNSYAFQARLGQAFMGVADEFRSQNNLGTLDIKLDETAVGSVPRLTSQRVGLYAGVLSAFARYLAILREPSSRQTFIEKNDEALLAAAEEGINAGMTHALLESHGIITRVSQINMNRASAGFVERSLASGRLDEENSLVKSFREVQADPLYGAVLKACEGANAELERSDMDPQQAWFIGSNMDRESLNAWVKNMLERSNDPAL